MENFQHLFQLGKIRQQKSLLPEILLYIFRDPLCKVLYSGSKASRKYLIAHFALLNKETNPLILAVKGEKITMSDLTNQLMYSTQYQVTFIERIKTDTIDIIACGFSWSGLYFFCTSTGKLLIKLPSVFNTRCCYLDKDRDLLFVQAQYPVYGLENQLLELSGPRIIIITLDAFKLLPSQLHSNILYFLQKDGYVCEYDSLTGGSQLHQMHLPESEKPLDLYVGVVITCLGSECLAMACNLGLVLWDTIQVKVIAEGKIETVEAANWKQSVVIYSCAHEAFKGIIIQDLEQGNILKKIDCKIYSKPISLKLLNSFKRTLIMANRKGVYAIDLDRDNPQGILLWKCPKLTNTCKNIVEIEENTQEGKSQVRLIGINQEGKPSKYSLIQMQIPL
ncbi:hypothetical protein FGO68_gene4640 [Halteria grandinella]|uniref:Uncharacterized protein n=1 Tax=Halteria grandinella TaxID=5974 RepID=A0A8J8NMH9_HALGN|nr:hypothetical protein FGO68_gene4640 [Halteria grandinella]